MPKGKKSKDNSKVTPKKEVELVPPQDVPAHDVPEAIIKRLEVEMQRGYREVEIENRGKIRIHFPSMVEEMEISDLQAKMYNRLMQDEDMLSEDQIKAILIQRNMWNEEDDKELDRLNMRVANLSADILLSKGDKNPNAERISKLQKDRNSVIEERRTIINRKSAMFKNSIEARVEEHGLALRLSLCVKDPDGNRIWEDVDALGAESDRLFISQVMMQALYFWNAWSPDFFEDSLETAFGNENTL
jgi:hypothetical protein